MRKSTILILGMVVLMGVSVCSASPMSQVRENKDSWVCYDYALSYAYENPEWGVVYMGSNPYFLGTSHIMAYTLVDDKIYLRDVAYTPGEYGGDVIEGYMNAYYYESTDKYFHFYTHEELENVPRFYKRGKVKDNREEFLCSNGIY